MKFYHGAVYFPLSLCYLLLNPANIKAPEPFLHSLRVLQVPVQTKELKAETDVACITPNSILKQNLRKCKNLSMSDA